MVLVAGLSSLRLGQRLFVLDEEVSLAHARETWGGVWRVATRFDPNMSLYYAALKIWTGIFGDSVVAVRSLSVVAAILCVPVVYAIGVRLFGTYAGLLAGLLIATNVFFLEYAQVARSYALLTLLVALSSYFFVAEFERPQFSSRAGYIAFSVLAFYAHAFAIWVLLVQLLTLAAFRGREAVSRTWLTSFGLIGAFIAPMAYMMQRAGGSGLYWIEDPALGAIPATYAQLAGDSFLHLGIVVAACALALRRAPHSKRLAFGLAFTAMWAFLPVLATFAASQAKPIFIAKYLIVSLPAMVLLAAGAIVNVRPVSVAVIAVCLLVALSVPELHRYYGWPTILVSQSPTPLYGSSPASAFGERSSAEPIGS
jgi:mannosyltransferase